MLYAVAIVASAVARLHSSSVLWLDEALSVNIARLPLPDLFAALRQDGSPPLYYLLLHAWMTLFGTGNGAVRALSTLFSLAALPAAYALGRRFGGRRAGGSTMLVLAASPFAIRYATETRMYALVMLLALLLILALVRALDSPTIPRLAAVAALGGALALTHYWTLFFLVAGELWLLAAAHRRRWQGRYVRVAAAAPTGGLLFLPWLPTFVFQSVHTGTPWRPPPGWLDLLSTVLRWGGPGPLGVALGLVLAALAACAVRTRTGRRLLGVGLGGLALGLLASRVQGSAYALRYSAPLLVPVLLAAGLGLTGLPRRPRQLALVAVSSLSLAVVVFSSLLGPRTQAAPSAAVLRSGLGPGDTVVYCPDQLGPAISRLLPSSVHQVVYPTAGSPRLVDWVDYAARNAAASPADFAARVDATTMGRVWLVRADGFLTYGGQCSELDRDLRDRRRQRTVRQTPDTSQRDATYVVEYSSD